MNNFKIYVVTYFVIIKIELLEITYLNASIKKTITIILFLVMKFNENTRNYIKRKVPSTQH